MQSAIKFYIANTTQQEKMSKLSKENLENNLQNIQFYIIEHCS